MSSEIAVDDPSVEVRNRGLGTFKTLRDDVLLIFLGRLSLPNLVKMTELSGPFYMIANEDYLWKKHCLASFTGELDFRGTWKATCISLALKKRNIPYDKYHVQGNHNINVPGFRSEYLYAKWYFSRIDLQNFIGDTQQIERIDFGNTDHKEFISRFDAQSKPAMIKGITDDWSANQNWTEDALNKIYGDNEFRISHKEGGKVRLKMKDYIKYCHEQHDEIPLYVFDTVFGDHAPAMLKDYEVPQYFKEDFLELLGDARPNYRWFVMGPMRSGSPWHVDPHGTSAWNSLLSGKKRWALYPPDVLPPGVSFQKTRKGETKFISPFPLEWFFTVYPNLPPELKPMEITQLPGETIYVPRGWWHCVLNIENTVAVTQNFINGQNLIEACEDLIGDGRIDDFTLLKKRIEVSHPQYKTMLDGVETRMQEYIDLRERKEKEFKYFEAVTEVCEKLKIEPPSKKKDIGKAPNSTNLVFFYQDMAFKFYRNPKDGEESFLKESELFELISSLKESNPKTVDHLAPLCPVLKMKGRMNENHDLKWKWPYIVTSIVKGVSIMESVQDLSHDNLLAIARSLATTLSQFHNLPTESLTGVKNEFFEFLTKQRTNCYKKHSSWGTLTFDMINKIEHYLPKNDPEIIRGLMKHMKLLHADVTDENVLLSYENEEELEPSFKRVKGDQDMSPMDLENGKEALRHASTMVVSGLIDFGDCMIGDMLYELVSLHISAFRCDKKMLKAFMDAYGLTKSFATGAEFAHLAMTYTLLHVIDAIRTVYQWKPHFRLHHDWESLANALWNYDQE